MPRHMLDVDEAADYMKISKWTLYAKAKNKEIPCVHVGRRVLFSQEGLDKWFQDQENQSIIEPKPTTRSGKTNEPNFAALFKHTNKR